MTRGQCGSLLLHSTAPASATPYQLAGASEKYPTLSTAKNSDFSAVPKGHNLATVTSNRTAQKSSRDQRKCLSLLGLSVIAGGGFEPPTSGLWARRATRLLYPAINSSRSAGPHSGLSDSTEHTRAQPSYCQKIPQFLPPIKRKKQLFQILANLFGQLFQSARLVFK